MDFLRCYSNIMTSVFGSPQALFSQRLWGKMLCCQAKPSETTKLLADAGLNMEVANEMIQSSRMNWTTFLVSICEVRQAMRLAGPELKCAIVGLQQRPDVQSAVPGLVEDIVAAGAEHREGYCVRLVRRVSSAAPYL